MKGTFLYLLVQRRAEIPPRRTPAFEAMSMVLVTRSNQVSRVAHWAVTLGDLVQRFSRAIKSPSQNVWHFTKYFKLYCWPIWFQGASSLWRKNSSWGPCQSLWSCLCYHTIMALVSIATKELMVFVYVQYIAGKHFWGVLLISTKIVALTSYNLAWSVTTKMATV